MTNKTASSIFNMVRTGIWTVSNPRAKAARIAAITSSTDNNSITKGNSSYRIYPNPVKDVLHIEINDATEFTLVSQSGKILVTTTIRVSGEINTSALAAGIYYLRNKTTGERRKIIITK